MASGESYQYQNYIAKTRIRLFDFSWFDSSRISLFQFGESLVNYEVEKTQTRTIADTGDYLPQYRITYAQSRVQRSNTWAIKSLDLALGVVGGISAITWGTLALMFDGYESFKYTNSLISAVYPTSPLNHDDGSDLETER